MRREDGRRFPALAEIVIRVGLQNACRVIWRPELINGVRKLELDQPCFVYGNHSHNYDPFIFNMFTRWMNSTAGVLTQEYFRKPFMNKALRNIDLYPTRKHVPEPHLIRNIYKQLSYKRSFLIYPEGGRRWAGQPIPWIDSTAKIFAKSGRPIYPIITYGSYIGWPRWATYPRPGKIKVKVLEPLQFDKKAPVDEVLAALKAPMDFDENIVPDDMKPKWAFRPAAGIHRLLYRDPESGENGGIFTPDGTYVRNTAGTINYKMLPDSTLLDEKSGEVFTTGELYNKVKSLPITSNADGIVVQNQVKIDEELEFPELIPHGTGTITMHKDGVTINTPSFSPRYSINEILYIGVERNSILQLFLKDKMIQATFTGAGSALQWQDTLQRLKATADSTEIDLSTK